MPQVSLVGVYKLGKGFLLKFFFFFFYKCTDSTTDVQNVVAADAWKHADFISFADNSLYNIHSPIQTAKELWDFLDKKYKTEDVSTKKFVVNNFLEAIRWLTPKQWSVKFKRSSQLILQCIHAKCMILSESFHVVAVNEKLPPSWRNSLIRRQETVRWWLIKAHMVVQREPSNSKQDEALWLKSKSGLERRFDNNNHLIVCI